MTVANIHRRPSCTREPAIVIDMPRMGENSDLDDVLNLPCPVAFEHLCKNWDKFDDLTVRRQIANPSLTIRELSPHLPLLREHPLADHYVEKRSLSADQEHAAAEISALRKIGSGEELGFVPGKVNILECIRKVAGAADLDSEVRSTPVFTTPDEKGVALRYPSPEAIHRDLNVLSRSLNAHSSWSSLTPIFVMVWVFNVHPLRDGNGRCARILFNLFCRQIFEAESFYLPIGIWSAASAGSFTLCIREAQFFGRWEPLLEWFKTLAKLHAYQTHGGEQLYEKVE